MCGTKLDNIDDINKETAFLLQRQPRLFQRDVNPKNVYTF